MSTGVHFLAFDLGAESGRAMLGRLNGGVLDVSEIHRFVNEPVRQNGSLHWDVLRLWLEIKRGMERAFDAVNAKADEADCDYRTAAYTIAISRVAEACRLKGLYP